MNKRSDTPEAIVFIVVVFSLLAIFGLSSVLGVKLSIVAEALGRLVPTLLIYAAIAYFLRPSFTHHVLLLAAATWFSAWPVLDAWSGHEADHGGLYISNEPKFYAEWYTKWGLLVAFLGLGYWLRDEY